MVKKLILVGFISWLTAFSLTRDVSAAETAFTGKEAIVAGNNQFALDLYDQLKTQDGNLFFSPNSISTALAMTYAGARGNTAAQMASTLHFTLAQARLHPAFFELAKGLEADPEKSGYQLSVANALWGQTGYTFLDEFVNITKKYYGAGFKELDFKADPESCRMTINRWVEDKTNEKIKDLLRKGLIETGTRLVLTNAIYFKGKWVSPFEKSSTKESDFALSGAETIKVPTMSETVNFKYAEDEKLQILEMPYKGDQLSMVILLPKEVAGLKALEDSFSRDNLDKWFAASNVQRVQVYLPKFKTTSPFELSKQLIALGMNDAFDERADFTGMTAEKPPLCIGAVIHKAYIDVYEEGTEAAAATAVLMKGVSSMSKPKPPVVFRADHPFVFMIRDTKSGSILFMGRVMDPRK